MKSRFIRSNEPINTESLQYIVPSAFAVSPWSKVSTKYKFYPTSEIIAELGRVGLGCFSARQSGYRIEGKELAVKHSLRFRPIENYTTPMVGDVFPELILTNSHDAVSCSLTLEMGLYKLACANGLVVSMAHMQRYRIRHVGRNIAEILQLANNIVRQFPITTGIVKTMQDRLLTMAERARLAELALGLRYDANKIPFNAVRLLETRRQVDTNNSLFTVYNVIQENLTQGMQRSNRLESTVRGIRSIDTDLKINRDLFQLAYSFV